MRFIFCLSKTLPIFFWFVLILSFNSLEYTMLSLAAAVIHELGHVLFGIATSDTWNAVPRGALNGFKIPIPSTLSYKQELAVALGGPLLNTLFGFFLLYSKSDYFSLFGLINILTALSNLIPIECSDGYRILKSIMLLCSKNTPLTESLLFGISFFTSSVLTFFSLFLIFLLGEGYWAFFVFFYSLMLMITHRRQNNQF